MILDISFYGRAIGQAIIQAKDLQRRNVGTVAAGNCGPCPSGCSPIPSWTSRGTVLFSLEPADSLTDVPYSVPQACGNDSAVYVSVDLTGTRWMYHRVQSVVACTSSGGCPDYSVYSLERPILTLNDRSGSVEFDGGDRVLTNEDEYMSSFAAFGLAPHQGVERAVLLAVEIADNRAYNVCDSVGDGEHWWEVHCETCACDPHIGVRLL